MSTPPRSDQQLRHIYNVVQETGSYSKAAIILNLARQTVQDAMREAMGRLGLPDPRATVIDKPGFTAFQGPSKERPLADLLEHRRNEANRSIEADEFTKLFRIAIKASGPVGLMVFGDPHIDNPGCDFPLLEAHLKIASDRKTHILAGNIGDLRDNWIGRLERLYAQTTVTARETWKLVEWMMKGAGVHWAWLVRGNHDAWAGHNDPLDWIAKGAGVGIDQSAGVRIAFTHPNGAETRVNARHDFPGNSIYNPVHGLKREILHGFRDHVTVAGHRHIGADAGDVNGDGNSIQMIRVSGYKVADSFRHEMGFKAKPIHPAALIVVDPDLPDTSRGRAWCAPTVEEGAEYLDWKRERFNARPRQKSIKTKANK